MKAAVVVLAIVVGWLGSYASGAWPWIGWASLTRSSYGAGGLTIVGESRRGLDIGFNDFVFFEGQEVVIEYDVEVRAGSLWFHVFQPWDGTLGDGVSHYVSASGKGTWTMPVRDTGYYHVTIEGSPTRGPGRGWDLTYEVRWGARSAR